MFALVVFVVLVIGAIAHEVTASLREESRLHRRHVALPAHEYREDRLDHETVEASLYAYYTPVAGPR